MIPLAVPSTVNPLLHPFPLETYEADVWTPQLMKMSQILTLSVISLIL